MYYHEVGVDTAVSLDFELGGSAARVNIFNDKDSEFLIEEEEKAYLQSMAGHKVKLEFLNIDYLNNMLSGKAINRVSIDFECLDNPNYPAHEKIYLARKKEDGEIVLLKDFNEGDEYFGGKLDGTIYSFNITRYFVQLLTNNEYTDVLYLLSSGGSANANRTILDKNKTSVTIIYTDI